MAKGSRYDNGMQVALVHDFLLKLGGAERVLKVFSDMYPKAPIYTFLYDETKMASVFPTSRIIASKLQRYPRLLKKHYRYLLPLLPRAIEEWDFSDFDLVISSNTAFAHGIVTSTKTTHVSYFHSPMRFAWDWYHEYKKEQRGGFFKNMAIAILMKKIRMWDRTSADRVDFFLANSETVRRRIAKYYRQDAEVMYPPVDISRYKIGKEHQDFFLIVSTLTPYKRIDLAIQLFSKIKRRLVIIGDGPHMEFLKSIASPNIDFLGYKPDDVVAEYMQNCRALIFPGEDDFGITPVEAMACGKPVLAYGFGGATETVIPGVTGELFFEPTIASMEQGLAKLLLNEKNYHPYGIRRHAEQFDTEIFKKKMRNFLRKTVLERTSENC